jgi:two-component system, LytTR family, response regulator
MLGMVFKKSQSMDLLLIPHQKGVLAKRPEEIVRVEGHSNYSKIYFDSEKPLLVSKVLMWFETRLPEKMFVRVHRSHLVNRMHVANIVGKRTAILNNGETICISRRKKNSFN